MVVSTENEMFVKESVPTAVDASAFATPERPIVTLLPTVVAARKSLNVLSAPLMTWNGTLLNVKDIILVSTSVVDGPCGIANWAKD